MISMSVVGAGATSAALLGGAGLVRQRTTATTRKYAMLLQTRIRANASGRPGPRKITGDYRRSWTVRYGTSPAGAFFAEVGTNAPQARRLEYGFMGLTDRLGRTFHQPPYPHVRPAWNTTAPAYERAIRRDVRDITAFVATSRGASITGAALRRLP